MYLTFTFGLLLVIAIIVIVGARKWQSLHWRPIVGTDFKHIKILLADLYRSNTSNFNLAGIFQHPIRTDSRRPFSHVRIKELSDILHDELANSRGYKDQLSRDRSTLSRSMITRTNKSFDFPGAGTQGMRLRRLAIEVASGRQRVRITELRTSNNRADLHPQKTVAGKGDLPSETIARLFSQFVKLRKNWASPLGKNFKIPYDEFVNTYGYGQCHNQSAALCDLLGRHGFRARLLHLREPPHTIVEVQLENGEWGILDPLHGVHFIPLEGMSVQHAPTVEDVQLNFEKVFDSFSLKPTSLDSILRSYSGTVRCRELYRPTSGTLDRSYVIGDGAYAEYVFDAMYPWVSTRNIFPPPTGCIGAFKKTMRPSICERYGEKKLVAVLTAPYRVVDVEVTFAAPGIRPDLLLEADRVTHIEYDRRWGFVRLRRYVQRINALSNHAPCLIFKNVDLSAWEKISVTVVSQISVLPYYLFSDGVGELIAEGDHDMRLSFDFVDADSTDLELRGESEVSSRPDVDGRYDGSR